MFKRIREWFRSLEAPKQGYYEKRWFTFKNGHMILDVKGFLASPEGKASLARERAYTDRLIREGKIIDLTKK